MSDTLYPDYRHSSAKLKKSLNIDSKTNEELVNFFKKFQKSIRDTGRSADPQDFTTILSSICHNGDNCSVQDRICDLDKRLSEEFDEDCEYSRFCNEMKNDEDFLSFLKEIFFVKLPFK